MKDLGEQVTSDEKTAVETAVAELETSTKENDVEDIKAKTEALQNIIMPITQRAYEAAQGQGGAEGFDRMHSAVTLVNNRKRTMAL